MKRFAWLAAAAVIVIGVAGFAFVRFSGIGEAKASVWVGSTTKTYAMTVDGAKRSYEVIAPDTALPSSAPVVVMLAGIKASIPSEVSRDDLVPYVHAADFELVYPVGEGESWNAGSCCGYASAHDVNDVAFMKALVAKLDPGHQRPVDVLGFSNGARLAYRIACTDPTLFDAYAMVKGVPMAGCVVTKPVDLIEIAAKDDPEIPYGPGNRGLEPLLVTTEMWKLQNSDQCPKTSTVTHAKDMTLTTWSGCSQGTRLAFAVWPTGQHLFPRPPVTKEPASAAIWAFFSHSKLAPVPGPSPAAKSSPGTHDT